jgi:hypothetical protein
MMKLRINPIALLCALVVLAPAVAAASSLDVNADAAMGNSSSSACGVPGAGCGLEVLVTSPATAAYVQSDHMLIGGGESAVRISFIVDPGHPNPANPANLLNVGAPGHIRALIALEGFIPQGTRMIAFVRRNNAGTAWRLHIWIRDAFSNSFVEAGAGFLVGGGATTATRVDIEWDATGGNGNGIIRASRTLDSPGASTVDVFPDVTNLNMGGQTLGIIQAGDPGFGSFGSPTGSLYLDEFVISRL